MLDGVLKVTAAVAMGLLLGVGLISLGRGGGFDARLDRLEQDLGTPPAPLKTLASGGGLSADLGSKPILLLTVGADAAHEAQLSLNGVAISPGRRAALLSVGGEAPSWMNVGEAKGDIVLTSVTSAGADVETPLGPRHVGFGDGTAPAAAGQGASPQAGSPQPKPSQPPVAPTGAHP